MNKQQRGIRHTLGLLGIPVLVATTLFWSVGLCVGGLWWLVQYKNQSRSPEKSSPENFALVQNVPTGTFSYGGSDAWAAIRLKVDSAIQSERPEFQLRYIRLNQSPTASRAIEMLLSDRLTLVQSARPLHNKDYQQAQEQGLKLKQIPIAIDGIAIAVHPNLNISGLTLDQLRSIYTGKISNWKQIGGPELEIVPYSPPAINSDTSEFFRADILKGKAFAPKVEFIGTTTQALRQLANTPGGIYYASAPEIVPQCSIKALPIGRTGEMIAPYQQPRVTEAQCPNQRNQINTKVFQTGQYPITRYLYVVAKENSGIAEQAGVAYANFLLTTQGQELIAKTGFVPLR